MVDGFSVNLGLACFCAGRAEGESGAGAAVGAGPGLPRGPAAAGQAGSGRQGLRGVGGSAEPPAGIDEAGVVVAIRVGVEVDGVGEQPGGACPVTSVDLVAYLAR